MTDGGKMGAFRKATTFIYGLKDPRDKAVRYVGKSDRPRARLVQHLLDRTSNPYKTKWLDDLRAVKKKPELVILEEVNEELWPQAEQHWIDLGYRRGWPLTNIVGCVLNGGISRSNSDELDEVMFHYLPQAEWNRFCGLSADDKATICRLVALYAAEWMGVAIKARAKANRANPLLQHQGVDDRALQLVRANGTSAYGTLVSVYEAEAKELSGLIDAYMAARR